MKYLLTLLPAVCSPCVAQTKVWEWNAPNIDHGGLYGSDIVAWASDRSGNSAIVLGEHAQTTSPVIVVNRLRIL